MEQRKPLLVGVHLEIVVVQEAKALHALKTLIHHHALNRS